eukprot:scaffold10511_cov129-Isochrysis_galbana.AAC.8
MGHATRRRVAAPFFTTYTAAGDPRVPQATKVLTSSTFEPFFKAEPMDANAKGGAAGTSFVFNRKDRFVRHSATSLPLSVIRYLSSESSHAPRGREPRRRTWPLHLQ